jgi:hypothetical protein
MCTIGIVLFFFFQLLFEILGKRYLEFGVGRLEGGQRRRLCVGVGGGVFCCEELSNEGSRNNQMILSTDVRNADGCF